MLKLTGRTAQDVAKRLRNQMASPQRPLYLIPFNRFDLGGENTWWISRTHDNPAYAFTKFFCSNAQHHGPPSRISCGLHAEKGFEKGSPDPVLEMNGRWEWHLFVQKLRSPTASAAIDTALAAVGESLRLNLVLSAPEFKESEQMTATVTTGGAIVGTALPPPRRFRVIDRLAGCTSLESLGSELAGAMRDASVFYWIDLYISSEFDLVASTGDDIEKCIELMDALSQLLEQK